MTNEYFTFGEDIAPHTLARAQQIAAYLRAIALAFDKLPDPDALNNGALGFGVATGVANAYVLTLDPAPTAYEVGSTFHFLSPATNTGASTINVNALGAVSIRDFDGLDLSPGMIPNGGIVTVRYDGTVFRLNRTVGAVVPLDGSVTTAKVANDAVTNAKLANMAQATIKGRASASGTGDPVDLSAAQVIAILGSAILQAANNLSDVSNAATARTNLGLGTAATASTGTGASNVPTVAQADGRYARLSQNLGDVPDPAAARDALGLPSTFAAINGSAAANFDVDKIFVNDVGSTGSPSLSFTYKTGGGIGFYSVPGATAADDLIRVTVDGTLSANFEKAGTAAKFPSTVLTRDKGDFRYIQKLNSDDAIFKTVSAERLYAEFTGSAAAPAIELFTNGANTSGFYVGADTESIGVSVKGVLAAAFSEAGTSAPQTTTIITREKGDLRYAKLNGVSSADFSVADLIVNSVGAQAGPSISFENKTGGAAGFYSVPGGVAADDVIRVSIDNVGSADFEKAGTAADSTLTVMTREKADARYLLEANNLSDLNSAATARTNLGLGTAALVNTGTGSTNVPTIAQADARYAAAAEAWPGVYNGTALQNVTFPIGTTISLLAAFVGANAAMTIYVTAAGAFTTSSSGNAGPLTGTWRARGNSDGTFMTAQRTA